MIILKCINNKGERFEKEFNDVYDARNFMLKCSYSKRIDVLAYKCDSQEESEFLGEYF